MTHEYCWGWHMPIVWMLWTPLMILATILFIRLFIKSDASKNKFDEFEKPMDILRRRFANGEMTIEEYQNRKKILEGN